MVKVLAFFLISGYLTYNVFFYTPPTMPEFESSEKELEVLVRDKKVQEALGQVKEGSLEQERTPSSYQVQNPGSGESVSDNINNNDDPGGSAQSYFSTDSFIERFKNQMTPQERQEVVKNLELEISNELNVLKQMEVEPNQTEQQTEAIESFEEGIRQKEEQLKKFQNYIDSEDKGES
jgi:uncharacterized protein YdaT